MRYILLAAAVYNVSGSSIILLSMWVRMPFGVELPPAGAISPPDYAQYRLFTVGAAYVFGGIYYYLYLHPQYAVPFLVFGMALKYWAFISSLVAHLRYGLPREGLLFFGVSNLVFAVLFSAYLLV